MNPRNILIGSITAALIGCATTTLNRHSYVSYTVGKTSTAIIGEAFLVDQSGTVETVKKWVGILNSPTGWATETRDSKGYVRKELIYAGRSGTTLEISYREFREGYAAAPFFQNLKYDLVESNIIRFQRFTIEVNHADNKSITFKILSDR